MVIEKIDSPEDLKILSITDLKKLAKEIREALVTRASTYGGHLGSNLGVVELTIALHYVFNSPYDKIIFDVSHQSYVHKMLTGRKEAFLNANKYDTVTGFTNPKESVHDQFNIGHTSTSISLASGLAVARDLKGSNENIIAVIGDAALDGGEAFEALNYVGECHIGLIIILNDNGMSIPENHGSLNIMLNKLRTNNGIVEDNYFKSLGYNYYFVKDGHDIDSLIKSFNMVKGTKNPVVVHCCTTKGKGYPFAENNQEKWHHAHPFNIITGEFDKTSSIPKENYGSIVGSFLIDKIRKDNKIVAMTASVPACFGFDYMKRKEAGKQYIDVGIAEQNLITMASALAKGGCKPIVITESSFYQRAYDQIEQELCINRCPATLLVAFSGIYAHNDDTHIGFFDISLLGNIPRLIYLAPSNKQQYLAMLEWSIEQNKFPVAIRIPWNGVHYTDEQVLKDYSKSKYSVKRAGKKVALIGLGSFFQLAENVSNLLFKETGICSTLIDPIFISDCDEKTLNGLVKDHSLVVTLEDGIISGGFGSKISQFYSLSDIKVLNLGFGFDIPTVFSTNDMLKKNGLLPDQIVKSILEIL